MKRSSRDIRRRRVWALAGLGVLAAVLFWFWWHEPAWTVTISPGTVTVEPGAPLELTAQVTSASVKRGATWKWTSPTGTLTGNGPGATFTADRLGEHRVRLTVRSARGTEHFAEAVVNVALATYFVGAGDRIREVKSPADDPVPDIVRKDLPYRIFDITVDKPILCRGEKTVIHVHAQDDEGKADWLVPAIGGRLGWDVSLIVPATKVGRYKIPVQLGDPERGPPGDPQPYVQGSAFLELQDCDAPAAVYITTSQDPSVEEYVTMQALYKGVGGRPGEPPASYVWDFGDDSKRVTTTEPRAIHRYPNEEDRGPTKRIFSYLIKVDALDGTGQKLASGTQDIWFRNRYEEWERRDHRIQLAVHYPARPDTDSNGNHFMDITVKNLSADETANLTGLEYRLVDCGAMSAATARASSTRTEHHGVSDVFSSAKVAPRGTISGQFRWPKDGSPDVCRVDVSLEGKSEPGQLTVGGEFSMQTRLDQGGGLRLPPDPATHDALALLMKKLNRSYITHEDIQHAAEQGDISPDVASTLLHGKTIQPAPSGAH